MVINDTTTTLTITPAVGAAIVLTGGTALSKLHEILNQPGSVYSYNRVTGVYTGTFNNGFCCANFATTQANLVINLTLSPIVCVL